MISFTCPRCKHSMTREDHEAGQKFPCPSCGQRLQVPRLPPPPIPTAAIATHVPTFPQAERPAPIGIPVLALSPHSSTDAPGVISLIFGCLSVACMLLGCFTCGATYYAALPFALIGGCVGFFGQGNMRVAGITLNLLALIPTVVLLFMMIGGVGIGLLGSNAPSKFNTVSNQIEEKRLDKFKKGTGRRDDIIKVSSPKLFRDYEANEVAADLQYKGKRLEINGRVDSIGKDILNTIYVTLSVGGEFEIFKVQCFFSNTNQTKAARLKKGQDITIRGQCDGKFGNVLIKDCEFIDIESGGAP